jgi:HK97 gp10 family phage protein
MSFKNEAKFLKDLELHLVKKPEKNAIRVMESATRMVANTAIQSIAKGGRGRAYSRKSQPPHIASAPGDPPATDTGELIRNITTNVKKDFGGKLVGQIISGAPYSAHLEFGTTQMEKRPFLQPALKNNHAKIIAKFKKAGLTK